VGLPLLTFPALPFLSQHSRLLPTMSPQRTLDIEQFRPSFSDSELAGLKQTLEHSRLPARTYAMDQAEYGITYDYMKEALDRWKNGFDWYVSSKQRESGGIIDVGK